MWLGFLSPEISLLNLYPPRMGEPPAQGSSTRKIILHNCWLQKPAGISWCKKVLEPQAVPLKEPTHVLTYSDSLPLSSITRVAAGKAPVVYREKLKCLVSRPAEAIIPFLNTSPSGLAVW